MKNINIDLDIIVKNFLDKSKLIVKNFSLFIREDFLFKNKEKAQNLENHINHFKEKIKINQQAENTKSFDKYDIYYVKYGINIGNEINWIRPSLVFKASRYSKWSDTIVIPMTSLYNEDWSKKVLDDFDIIIKNDWNNKLKKESILKLRLIKSISKKRIWSRIWKLQNTLSLESKNYLYDQIDNKIKQILWLK